MARSVPDLALLLSVQAGYRRPRSRARSREDPAIFARAARHATSAGMRIGWLGDHRRGTSADRGLAFWNSARPRLRVLGRAGRGAWSRSPARLPAGDHVPELDLAARLDRSPRRAGAIFCRPRDPCADEARGAVGGTTRHGSVSARPRSNGPVAGQKLGLVRVRSGACSTTVTTPSILPSAQAFPFSVDTPWPDVDRGPHHGHLPPLDGGDDPVHHGEPAGHQRAGRFRVRAGLPMGMQIAGPNSHAEWIACIQVLHTPTISATGWVSKRPPGPPRNDG